MFFPDFAAAFAVLVFALVATIIPKKPASIENAAPTTKQIEVDHPIPLDNPKTKNTTITKIARVLYSLFKNAIAPL